MNIIILTIYYENKLVLFSNQPFHFISMMIFISSRSIFPHQVHYVWFTTLNTAFIFSLDPLEIFVAQGGDLVEELRNKADLRLKRN